MPVVAVLMRNPEKSLQEAGAALIVSDYEDRKLWNALEEIDKEEAKLKTGSANTLSHALQQKDQDILNAMSCVNSTRNDLQQLRDDGWESLLEKIYSFCEEHDIPKVNMHDEYVDRHKPRKRTNITNRFDNLDGIADLAKVLVETKKHLAFPLAYQLLKLVLILPVATASVERYFSAMNIVKSVLRNKMGDEFMSDCLICYVEKDIFSTITNDDVIDLFKNMKDREGKL
ncbi:uncharacterized protein [Aegilops tauschii subsp. strangulata]|uniref:uncharacterized protein n=1 Tax=Aegilops tauschii subsp. strangulata TaxID=200361 RepID=UPI003CC8A705